MLPSPTRCTGPSEPRHPAFADTDEDGDFIAKARQAAAQEKAAASSAPTVIGKKRGAGTGTFCTWVPDHAGTSS